MPERRPAGSLTECRGNMAATVRLEVDPESYWLYTSSARDSARRAEAVEQHGLEAALAHLAAGR